MPDKERRAERTEQEDIAGVTRGLRRKESSETSKKARKYAVKKVGEKWTVSNINSGKVVYTTGTEEAAYKKRDELLKRSDSLWSKTKKFFKGSE